MRCFLVSSACLVPFGNRSRCSNSSVTCIMFLLHLLRYMYVDFFYLSMTVVENFRNLYIGISWYMSSWTYTLLNTLLYMKIDDIFENRTIGYSKKVCFLWQIILVLPHVKLNLLNWDVLQFENIHFRKTVVLTWLSFDNRYVIISVFTMGDSVIKQNTYVMEVRKAPNLGDGLET